jgi:hypothetical protein
MIRPRDWFAASVGPGRSGRAAAVLAGGADGGAPDAWLELAAALAGDGLMDEGAVPALRQGLDLFPGHAGLRLALAEAEFQAGLDDAARLRLAPLLPGDCRAVVLSLHFDLALGLLRREALVDAAGLLLNHLPWDQPHEDFVALCRRGDHPDLGALFALQWIKHRGEARQPGLRAAETLMEAGDVGRASGFLLDLWRSWPPISDMIGDWTGLPPDDAAAEADVLGQVEHAFSLPDNELPVHPLPDCGRGLAGVPVLYLGAEPAGGLFTSNDMAEHFAAAAAAAGGNLTIRLDSVLADRPGPRCPDAEAARRRDAFVAELDRLRPEIVMYDVQVMPGGRTFTIEDLRRLKAQFGFRLLHVVRDGLKALDRQLQLWASVADGLLLFDPRSYVFSSPAHADIAARSLAIPVPALHPPFVPAAQPPTGGLVFVGSTFSPHRSCLLAGLAAADIGLEMVIGPARARIAPDHQAYARLLAAGRSVLNVAAHGTGEGGRLVTGRVWETIATGSLLVEQMHDGTASFFAPWRHFLPWSEPADIIRRWRVLARHEDLRARIAAEARAWALRHYGIDKVWRAIISHGLRLT